MSNLSLAQSGTPSAILNRLLELELSSEALAFLALVNEHRPAVHAQVMCVHFGIACYQVGESCFADQAPASEQTKWFVSVLSGSQFDVPHPELQQNFDTLELAEAAAVNAYQLQALYVRSVEVNDQYAYA